MRRILVLTLGFCLSSAPLLAQTLQSSINRAGATELAAQQAVRGPIPPGWLWTGVSLLGASGLFLAVGIGYHECDYYYARGINPSSCGTDGPFWRGMGAGLAGAGATLIIIGMSKRSSNPQIIVTPGRIGVKQTIRF